MNKTDNREQLQEEAQRPFHVVLVDIKKAVQGKLHCVEIPLTQSDLTFVALSYRWGELQETVVDTKVGYMATITSFDLDHFFELCRTITQEVDLQHMEYVWVDAICVNQTNHEQRKSTIYHMTDIYQRANYILAVPDLHLRYLDEPVTTCRITYNSYQYSDYLYYLIQGNIEKLMTCDENFLDENEVPKDRQLRHLLQKYTEHFTIGLMTCRQHDPSYNPLAALYHIYETNTTSCTQSSSTTIQCEKVAVEGNDGIDTLGINELHVCDNVDTCPFKLFHDSKALLPFETSRTLVGTHYQEWKQAIPKRSAIVRQSMDFLRDLIVEWSTRAWVVSEFHIAKNKSNKMKYWFLQLELPANENAFFTFDFIGADWSTSHLCGNGGGNTPMICSVTDSTTHKKDAVYQTFHAIMRQQLSQQTFLEKILKSKASKHEDRFYAILPSSEYKSMLSNKKLVDHWNTNMKSLVGVKLQLYDWMTTKHKLELLLLSCFVINMNTPMPTFASPSITWPDREDYPNLTDMDDPQRSNFDLTNTSTIQLIKCKNGPHKLNIKPREYYCLVKDEKLRIDLKESTDGEDATVLMLLGGGGQITLDQVDIILIPLWRNQTLKTRLQCKENWDAFDGMIVLLGCSVKNKWVVSMWTNTLLSSFQRCLEKEDESWKWCQCDENSLGFDIY